MTVSDDVIRIWMRFAKRNLRRYRDHPHYDDIVATAYMVMWEAIANAPEGSVRNLKSYAMRAAWHGAQTFLSSPANAQRTWSVFKRKAMQPTLYVEDIRKVADRDYEHPSLVTPDFAPPLIDLMAAQEALAKLSPKRRAAILLCVYGGLTRDEACAQLGWARHRIDYYLRGVSRDAVPNSHPGGWRPRPLVRESNGQFTRSEAAALP
jgi:DNA-directed RNA polymerase specialized sigma24 family protein